MRDFGFELRQLRELVRQRQLCWDVFPERVGIRGITKTVGYELVLSGIHAPADNSPVPGCALCKDVFRDLKTVAEWILPREHRPSTYEIENYEPIIRQARRRHLRKEVSLSVKILHRHHYENPIDQCETRCLREMEQRLAQLGACHGEWRPLSQREPLDQTPVGVDDAPGALK